MTHPAITRTASGLVNIGLLVVACLPALAHSSEAASPISASSVHPGDYPAHYALDGNAETRWASQTFAGRPEWLQIDFQTPVPIQSLTIRWEAAYAAHYRIELSDDARQWRTLFEQKQGKGGDETLRNLAGKARYLRLTCLRPGPHRLFSVWEIAFPDPPANNALAEARRQLLAQQQARQAQARKQLAQAVQQLGLNQIVFAARASGVDGHWYANFGYYARHTDKKLYGAPGGRLYRLNLQTGNLATLLDDPKGHVRDPQVHYDGQRLIFSYRKGTSENYHLYEINADGTGLRQLTDGPWDDIEPAYLPDGSIAFVSSRCKRWVNCWLTQVAVIHRCDENGQNIRPLSSNNEHDNTPWVLPDGRILYQRWEYVDRSQVDYHHLWTMNPDGTGQMVYYGNMHPGTLMIDAKPIDATDRVLATFSPGHGQREHEGAFYVVDPKAGPDERSAAQRVGTKTGRDPYPVGQRHFLYAQGKSIRLSDYAGVELDLYTDPRFELHEPRPLAPRPRERVIPARTDLKKGTGKIILADIHLGRNMENVKRGEIKKLLVLETLPKPINYTGGMDPLTWGGSFTLERIVGTVPVEEDGSAYMELPALRSFFFVALDEKNLAVKRMQSFLTVQPGETLGCVGCHEQRTRTMLPARDLLAFRRPPSPIEPVPGVPEVIDFPRHIQPILDKHCVRCHDYDKPPTASHGPRAGGVILTGDRGPMFSHSYCTLTVRREFVDGRDQPRSNYPARALGSAASPLMKRLSGQHYGVTLSQREFDLVRLWIETGATYPGTYAALGTGMIGGYDANTLVETDEKWPESQAARQAMKRRCASCHQGNLSLPTTLTDENNLSFWRPDWRDPRLHRSRHLIFNLSRPEKSLALLAPLSQQAGGYARCGPVFATTNDPDYQKILALCAAGQRRLEHITRFDMPHFRPEPAYLREMRRYGILPDTSNQTTQPLDVYKLDQAYWQSLWWRPENAPPPPSTHSLSLPATEPG